MNSNRSPHAGSHVRNAVLVFRVISPSATDAYGSDVPPRSVPGGVSRERTRLVSMVPRGENLDHHPPRAVVPRAQRARVRAPQRPAVAVVRLRPRVVAVHGHERPVRELDRARARRDGATRLRAQERARRRSRDRRGGAHRVRERARLLGVAPSSDRLRLRGGGGSRGVRGGRARVSLERRRVRAHDASAGGGGG
eukprot:30566-Pelagococcus_subviridis.AAC.3